MARYILCRSLLILLLLPSAASGQSPAGRQYSISGSVHKEGNDEALPDARLQLLDDVGNLIHPNVLTNHNGLFSVGPLNPGDYQLVVECDGYEPARIRVTINRHDENVAIRLRPDSLNPAPGGNVVSARELAIPEKARSAFDKGTKLAAQSDYKSAAAQFERATQLFPGYYEAYAESGLVALRMKNFAAAEVSLRKSIELSGGKYPPPVLLLPMLLNDLNRPAEAETVARQATALEPKEWRGHYELARALLLIRRLPDAETSANAARELRPQSPEVQLLLSEIHRRTHNAEALLQDFDNYLRLAPNGPAAPDVRKLRAQLIAFMQSHPKPSVAP